MTGAGTRRASPVAAGPVLAAVSNALARGAKIGFVVDNGVDVTSNYWPGVSLAGLASRPGNALELSRAPADSGIMHHKVGVFWYRAAGQAWVLWLREEAGGQSLWLSRRSPDLATEHQRLRVAEVAGRGRGTGFPQLALAGGVAHVVWTTVEDGVAGLRGARIVPEAAP